MKIKKQEYFESKNSITGYSNTYSNVNSFSVYTFRLLVDQEF